MIAKFLDIKGKGEQEELHFQVPYTTEEETAERVILFQNANASIPESAALIVPG